MTIYGEHYVCQKLWERRGAWNDNSSDEAIRVSSVKGEASLLHRSHFVAALDVRIYALPSQGINGLIMLTHINSGLTLLHVCKPINTFTIKMYSSICCSPARKRNKNAAKDSEERRGKNRFGGAWNILVHIFRSMEIQPLFWTELISMFMRKINCEFVMIGEWKIRFLIEQSP